MSTPEPAAIPEQGPKYFVNLEGIVKPWDEPQISVPQIRELAGWDASQPIVEVNLEQNTEHTLAEGEIVALKPGQGFEKKIKFQRG
jgi:Multiubiquitin